MEKQKMRIGEVGKLKTEKCFKALSEDYKIKNADGRCYVFPLHKFQFLKLPVRESA